MHQFAFLSLAAFIGHVALRCLALNTDEIEIYFGCGCFWHVQHAFIKAEEQLLGRSADTYTSLSGYAGGNRLNAKGNTCYYDYTGLGHTEVVGLTVPRDKVAEFAAVFWKLFVGKDRIDTMDRGPAYRAAVGLPGGTNSDLLAVIDSSQTGNVAQTFELRAGAGDDPDTLGEALVWVYDSTKYPFYQAELYHQFHDDFMPGGKYPQSYNDLAQSLLADCRMRPTGCPSDQSAPPATCHGGSIENTDTSVESGTTQQSVDQHFGGSGAPPSDPADSGGSGSAVLESGDGESLTQSTNGGSGADALNEEVQATTTTQSEVWSTPATLPASAACGSFRHVTASVLAGVVCLSFSR